MVQKETASPPPQKKSFTEPVSFSHVPGNSNFRSSATNAVAIIPLLSNDKDGEIFTTNSAKSFRGLMGALSRYAKSETDNFDDNLQLVVPNSSLTRPGDWRYDNTPLKHFHWGHGCQRLLVFDGRPQFSRMAHDRLINHALTRNWIDLCPSRRTAAVIGVLNMRDCSNLSTLHRAEEELQLWAERYSTPPYEVTAHGRGFERDAVVKRLFVFDSFDETCRQVDLTKAKLGSSILAFPPANQEHTQTMDLHLNVVVNDLGVAIFQQLEKRIKESDVIGRDSSSQRLQAQRGRQLVNRLMGEETDEPTGSSGLSANNLKSVLNPESPANPTKNVMSHLTETANKAMSSMKSAVPKSVPQLLTPIDEVFDYSELSAKDADAMRKRESGRREKFAADLSLLAGSPMDAYERYLKAAEMCKSGSPDPLWYASAMEGCAAAHISMSEAGGYNVDEYLENNFQYPDQIVALAIMRPSSSDKNRQTTGNKQTLPQVIYTLGDEALNIMGRHPQTAPFYADLLLKLANYCANGEERDLMCRWGLGEGCYGGDVGDKRRWEKHSHSKQMFADLKGRDGEDLIAQITIQRCQKFSEMLHKATSAGALDPVTRVDVATRCISMCMKGLKPTIWKKKNNAIIPFPRKAAFFTAIAAEAASVILGETTNRRVSDLWLLASQLYSKTGNNSDLASRSRYGWATLRASTLHAIALYAKNMMSSEAAEQLLSLLSEIKPDGNELGGTDDYRKGVSSGSKTEEMVDFSTRSNGDSLLEDWSSRNDYDIETLSSLTSRGLARMKNAGIFSQMTQSASLLTVQGKWADDEPIPPIQLPLVESSRLCEHVLALRCVWPNISMEKCSTAQRRVVGHVFSLRKILPASSIKEVSYFSREGGAESDTTSAPPIYIASLTVAESEPSKILERTTIRSAQETNDSMATFFNPYDNEKKRTKNEVMLIAEEEERFVSIHFGNRLSIPLEIHSCQIEFEVNERWRILAPALSFTVPGKSTNFAIHFPFKPIPKENKGEQVKNVKISDEKKSPDIFEMKGLKIISLGKAFFIPVNEEIHNSRCLSLQKLLPDLASTYPRANKKKVNGNDGLETRHKFEVVSSQPRLIVSLSGSVIEDSSCVSVYLADGEVYTTNPFILENHVGTNGCGNINRLQIIATGLNGLRDLVLFDSDLTSKEKTKIFKKESRPLTVKALLSKLKLDAINNAKNGEKTVYDENSNAVSFQIVAANEIGRDISDDTKIKLKFRYRGKSPIPLQEIWRKHEIVLRIVRVRGPRISSLTFRPDLSLGSAYSELGLNLLRQSKKSYAQSDGLALAAKSGRYNDDPSQILQRVGMDKGVHVCCNNVVVLLSVANETNIDIILSNPDGSAVGGFQGKPMKTVKVSSGVSVRIPVVLPRVPRVDNNGIPTDVVAQVVAKTALQWEEVGMDNNNLAVMTTAAKSKEAGGNADNASYGIKNLALCLRKGRLRIPPSCLKEIIARHPTFTSRICDPPCRVSLSVLQKTSDAVNKNDGILTIKQGTPLDVVAEAIVADWLSSEVTSHCRVTLEFCCARKEEVGTGVSGKSLSIPTSFVDNKKQPQLEYVWCGQVHKRLQGVESSKKHQARIVILQPGHFMLSACARIEHDLAFSGVEEIWWSPIAENVIVEKSVLPN